MYIISHHISIPCCTTSAPVKPSTTPVINSSKTFSPICTGFSFVSDLNSNRTSRLKILIIV